MPQARNSNGKNFEWKGGTYADLLEKNFENNLDRAALFLVVQLKSSMEGGGAPGGRSGATKKARAAAAAGRSGQPPRVQTGRLKNSITFARRGRMRRGVGAGIGKGGGEFSEKGYAFFLEFRRGAGWRPWLRPGLNKNLSKIRDIINKPFRGPGRVTRR